MSFKKLSRVSSRNREQLSLTNMISEHLRLWLEDESQSETDGACAKEASFEMLVTDVCERFKNDEIMWADITSAKCAFVSSTQVIRNKVEKNGDELAERIEALFRSELHKMDSSFIDVFWISTNAQTVVSHSKLLKTLRRLRIGLGAKVTLIYLTDKDKGMGGSVPNLSIVFNAFETCTSFRSINSELLWRGGVTLKGKNAFSSLPGVMVEFTLKNKNDKVMRANFAHATPQGQLLVLDLCCKAQVIQDILEAANFTVSFNDQFGLLDNFLQDDGSVGWLTCLLVPSNESTKEHFFEQRRAINIFGDNQADDSSSKNETTVVHGPLSFKPMVFFIQGNRDQTLSQLSVYVVKLTPKTKKSLGHLIDQVKGLADSNSYEKGNFNNDNEECKRKRERCSSRRYVDDAKVSSKKKGSQEKAVIKENENETCHDVYYNFDEETERLEANVGQIVKKSVRKETQSSCLGTPNRQALKHMCLNLPSRRAFQKAKIAASNTDGTNSVLVVEKKSFSGWSTKKKSELRMAITNALESCYVSSDNELFKPAFNKLFRICHTVLDDVVVAKISFGVMSRVAYQFAQTVIDFQKMAQNQESVRVRSDI